MPGGSPARFPSSTTHFPMTYNEKELILQWFSNIEKLSKKKGYGNTPKQEYYQRLTGILKITKQAIEYLTSNP